MPRTRNCGMRSTPRYRTTTARAIESTRPLETG
jgi:hypothetical protein